MSKLIVSSVVLSLACGDLMSAEEAPVSLPEAAIVAVATPIRDYGKLLWDDVRLTLSAPIEWDRNDWLAVGIGSAVVVGTALTLDGRVDRAVQRNYRKSIDQAAENIEPFGEDYSFGVLGIFYLAGALTGDSNAKQVAGDGFAASLIAVGLISPVLKYSIGRSRPNDEEGSSRFRPFSGNASFPSGHTMQAFAIGSVIAEHYDQPWVDVAAYGLASAVGMARVYRRQHYLSDVIAGAIIGTSVGKFVVHINKTRRKSVDIMPVIWEDSYGLALGATF